MTIPEAVGGKVVVGNATSDNTSADGYVTGYPCDEARPVASDLNTRGGDIRSNRHIGVASQAGEVCLFTNTATDLITDFNGIGTATSFVNERTT